MLPMLIILIFRHACRFFVTPPYAYAAAAMLPPFDDINATLAAGRLIMLLPPTRCYADYASR